MLHVLCGPLINDCTTPTPRLSVEYMELIVFLTSVVVVANCDSHSIPCHCAGITQAKEHGHHQGFTVTLLSCYSVFQYSPRAGETSGNRWAGRPGGTGHLNAVRDSETSGYHRYPSCQQLHGGHQAPLHCSAGAGPGPGGCFVLYRFHRFMGI